VINLILFYVEFDNGDSNCYQGSRVPTIEEARVFCKEHIDSNKDWSDVAYVDEIDRAKAEGLWDLSVFEDKSRNWPVFQPEVRVQAVNPDRPFAYVCSPFRGDVEKNTARAREYCRQVYEAGYTPLAPHLYFTQFLNDDYPKERVAGMEMGVALLPMCRVLLVCGNDITEGMKAEIQHANRIGVEVCNLENIPPIPSLNSYRDDMTNLENFQIAVSLIEGMTNSRFEYAFGDLRIHPDSDSYFAVNMLSSFSRDDMFFRIRFNATPQKKSIPMSADKILKLQHEAGRIHTLLDVLKKREFILTPEEMKEYCNSLRPNQAQEHNAVPGKDTLAEDTGKPSVMKKIVESREKGVPNKKPKPGRPRKTHGEEL